MFFSRIRVLAGLIAMSSLPLAVSPGAALANEAAAQEQNAATEEAVTFAKSLTDDATQALIQNGASESEKLAAFQKVLAEGLALDVIGKFMLGESRKTMSDEQLERYNAVFPDYITKLYADQFADIVGKPLEIIDTISVGARDVIVRTQFKRTEGSPINVDWRIRKLKSGDQKAIDIMVSGVSIMLVKREEFSAFVAANGIDNLLTRLEAEASS